METNGSVRPNIYKYINYREFLADFMKHQKSEQGISQYSACVEAGLSGGYLRNVIIGRRNLSMKALGQLAPVIQLSPSESSFLNYLSVMADSKSIKARQETYKKILKFGAYRDLCKSDWVTYQYIKEWYYPVIREMTTLPEFKKDPKWIQQRLRSHVPTSDIEQAIEFLERNGFVNFKNDQVASQTTDISNRGGILSLAMAEFQRQMLEISTKSMFNDPRSSRKHVSQTVAVSKRNVEKIRSILDQALDDIIKVSEGDKRQSKEQLMHISLVAVPLLNMEAENE